MGMETYFARPTGLLENAETAISCSGPGPARKKRYTSSRAEDGEDAQMYLCGKAVDSRTRTVEECEIIKEERDVLEMRKMDDVAWRSFDALDSSEKTIDIPVDRW